VHAPFTATHSINGTGLVIKQQHPALIDYVEIINLTMHWSCFCTAIQPFIFLFLIVILGEKLAY
jgi:hypothetical protein